MTTTLPSMTSGGSTVRIAYSVDPSDGDWDLPEGIQANHSSPHGQLIRNVCDVLSARFADEPNTVVADDYAFRWNRQRPNFGVSPDVSVLRNVPSDIRTRFSMKLWEPGAVAPDISFEFVSPNHPHKDYSREQEGHSYTGVKELVVYDPHGFGPRSMGGPKLLHLWRRQADGSFARVAFGDGPAYSEVLCAWLVPDGDRLTIADRSDGSGRWLTAAEQERAAKEQERAAAEQERAAKVQAEARADRELAEKEQARTRADAAERERDELARRLHELEASRNR